MQYQHTMRACVRACVLYPPCVMRDIARRTEVTLKINRHNEQWATSANSQRCAL